MKRVLKADVEEYSNVDSKQVGEIYYENGCIGGSLAKKFVRIDNKYIQDYINIVMNTDSSYVTYLDDFIKNNYSTGELPLKYVSVLLKEKRNGIGLIDCEVLGSKIANLLKIPTVYNETIWLSNDKKVMSIDFVKPGNELISLKNEIYEEKKDGKLGKHEVNDLKNDFFMWENLIDAQLKAKNDFCIWECTKYSQTKKQSTNSKDFNSNDIQQLADICLDDKTFRMCQEQLKKDFVAEYLLKAMILDDADFYPRNVTIIQDKLCHKFYLGPSHDFELILIPSANSNERLDFYDRNIGYLMEKYPKETMKFCDNFIQAFLHNGTLNTDLISKLIVTNIPYKNLHQELIKNLTTNIQNFYQCFLENYYDLNRKAYNPCGKQK